MSTLNRLISRILLASLATLAVGAGCYNPKITPGSLKCNPEYLPECPDGFYCLSGICQKKGGAIVDARLPDAPVNKDTGVDKTDATSPPDMGSDVMCIATPVAGCTSVAGTCDPLCQTGCANCRTKCSANSKGVLTCNAPVPGFLAKEGRSCDIADEGLATQTDNCEPGLVCTEVACGVLCARFCRKDADCPNSFCNKALPGGLKACDVPTVDCNPILTAPGGSSGCPGMTTQACYLSTTIKDRTACDCVNGAKGINGSCGVSQDCFPGLVCVDAGGTGADFRCKQVCSLTGTPKGDCMAGTTCRPFLGSTKFGYCN